MSDIKHYKNVSYVKGHVRVNLRFAKYGPRFAKAQEWLGQQVLADDPAGLGDSLVTHPELGDS